ncbi:alpha/beta hydrolase [Poritiphilus flavus]|uniref:Alpha/beta hydrolase fold domain-containing protein n=1 Tax=Poritiphilus flavus TaxID=2697053 RepID=A0A6L9EBX6_9FLAO|nr:alpha/beta hydrolase [Poritiphilus flavus]NAS12142.1 alpha/beta hydrolase fold domain-containing protein [Poritiphilus flavus]
MRTSFFLHGLLMAISIQLFSQDYSPKKVEFVYKEVEGHEIRANIFLPGTSGLHPVVVYFHGGGFIFGNRDQGLNIEIKNGLLKSGYAVVSADYRLAPETKLEGILADVLDVIKWLRKNGSQEFNIDTAKIASIGGSAGGYLALSTGFDQDQAPNAIVAISPPTGFSTSNIQMGDLAILNQPGPYDIVKDSIVSYGNYESRMHLWRFLGRNGLALYEIFGFDPSNDEKRLEKFKLTDNINSNYPPTLLIQAENDHLVASGEVKDFHSFLIGKKVRAELYLVDNGHSNELIKQNPQAIDKMIRFLKKYMQ